MKKIYILIIGVIAVVTICYGGRFALEKHYAKQKAIGELLVNAVKCCDLENLKTLCEKYSLDIKQQQHDGEPLIFAVLYSKADSEKTWDIINFMLSKGCDINSREGYGATFLMRCIDYGVHPEIIRKMIEAGADVRLEDHYGNTALHYVPYSTNSKEKGYIVRYTWMLLKHGADINAENSSGESPLVFASALEQMEMLKLLLKSDARVNPTDKSNKSALYAAAQNGNYEAVKLLIEKGALINAEPYNCETPLSTAVFKEHKKTAKLLIEKGADLKQEGNHRVLRYAVSQNDYDFAKYLISKGAYMNGTESSESPLSEAAARGNLKMVKLLLDNGANPNSGVGMPPLVYSILYADHEIAELLLLHGANPDAEYKNGPSPRKLIAERIADPLFAREKEAYKKILEMMEKGKSRK